MTAFGAELQRLRLAAGLSQAGLAFKAGIDASYGSRLERGERPPPTRSVVLALCRELLLDDTEANGLLLLAGHNDALVARLAVLAHDPAARRALEAFVDAWPAREDAP